MQQIPSTMMVEFFFLMACYSRCVLRTPREYAALPPLFIRFHRLNTRRHFMVISIIPELTHRHSAHGEPFHFNMQHAPFPMARRIRPRIGAPAKRMPESGTRLFGHSCAPQAD
ncbi:MAG: hypothetical protein IJM59_07390 [Proteobacteria bacterium]|nr:hypothetical protein [Pseudomonadota bacterium]